MLAATYKSYLNSSSSLSLTVLMKLEGISPSPLSHLESNSQLSHPFRIVFYMSHSYNTPPPSAYRHLHFAMCTEHHRIYGHVLSKPLTIRTFQKHFLRFPMADSCPSLQTVLIDPVTNLNLVPANTASAPLHTCQAIV